MYGYDFTIDRDEGWWEVDALGFDEDGNLTDYRVYFCFKTSDRRNAPTVRLECEDRELTDDQIEELEIAAREEQYYA